MALSSEEILRIVVISVGVAFLIFLIGLAAWFWRAKLCSCCRRVKPVGRPRKELDPETGIELSKLNINKDAMQKANNKAALARERATSAGHPNPFSDEMTFDADDFRESEEPHPHEAKRRDWEHPGLWAHIPWEERYPNEAKKPKLKFEDVDLSSGHVRSKEED